MKSALLSIIIVIVVLGLWVVSKIVVDVDAYVAPDTTAVDLEPINVLLQQSFIDDLEARSENDIGGDLDI